MVCLSSVSGREYLRQNFRLKNAIIHRQSYADTWRIQVSDFLLFITYLIINSNLQSCICCYVLSEKHDRFFD